MTKHIIALTGPIDVGKSTVAQELKVLLAGAGKTAAILSFARPVKEMLVSLLILSGMPPIDARRTVYSKEWRNEPLPELNGATVRHATRTLGTEWGREHLGERYWADAGMRALAFCPEPFIIFDDARFASELDALREQRGFVGLFEIYRRGVSYRGGHRSEGELAGAGTGVANNTTPAAAAAAIFGLVCERDSVRETFMADAHSDAAAYGTGVLLGGRYVPVGDFFEGP